MHDLAIRNARICDGTGQPMFDGEIAVVDGRIAEIGDRVGPARAEVNAGGQVIAPGIIDNHTHYDAQITWDPYASPTLGLGVTTLLMGNCGFTIAPCRPADREATLKNLTQVEGMSLDALLEGTSQEYESFADYMGLLQSQGVVPNVAVYCGHSSVRTWVMGDDAVKREASDREIESMKSVVTQALKDGAVGFATSSFEGHNGWGGVPMPSRFAAHEEYNRLAGSLADVGTGCFMLTKGRPTPIDYLETLAADTGAMVAVAAVVYDHANPDQAFNDMRAIGDAVDRGRRMVAQTPCTAISMDFTLRGAYLFEALNSWRPAISLYEDTEGLRKFLAEKSFRDDMKRELVDAGALNRFTDQWHRLEILEVCNEEHRGLEGKMVADLAKAEGVHPLDWILDFSAKENFNTQFNAQILNADEEHVAKLIKDPNSTIGLADAGAHLFLFCDADFGLHLMGHWVRDLGVFSLEDAVAELTSKQAASYGIKDRGTLKKGYYADMMMFDPKTVGRGRKHRVTDLPAGAARLVRDGVGLHGVWVNGTRVVDENGVIESTARPGHVLRDFAS